MSLNVIIYDTCAKRDIFNDYLLLQCYANMPQLWPPLLTR